MNWCRHTESETDYFVRILATLIIEPVYTEVSRGNNIEKGDVITSLPGDHHGARRKGSMLRW